MTNNSAAPVLYDSHMHTPLCKHAWGKPSEYAAAAWRRGLKGIVITCHNPGPDGFSPEVRMALGQFDEYLDMVESARQEWDGRVDVRLGLESDFVPGMEPWLEQLHARAAFHHILGSVHPTLPYYKDAYLRTGALDFQRTYFRHLADAAETGLFDTLSHPDLVKNVFPGEWNVEALIDEIKTNLDRIAKTGVAMELNTSGVNKEIREMNPSPAIIKEMRERDIPVVLGSDSHTPHRVAADFGAALKKLQAAGYENVHICLERRLQEISIPTALASLRGTGNSQ